jgi:DNA-binding transcriptional LysR family regulator
MLCKEQLLKSKFANMHNKINWDDYQYFLKVALLGSLKGAAEAMGVNHSTVFRRINSLEDKMDVRLFERLKTGYVLTDAGEEILEQVQRIEDRMHKIDRKLLGKDIRLSGTIKISTTDTLGYYWLPPYIRQFKDEYPNIVIDVDIKTRFTNLSRREADIVIPTVNEQPDYMVGRQLAPIIIGLYASKAYVDRHGKPQKLGDLSSHRILFPNEALAGLPLIKWLRKYVPSNAIAASSDKLTGLYKIAQQGLGIAPLPHYVGDSDPDLVKVMELPQRFHRNIWILTHPDLRHTARIRAFMKFMYQATRVTGNR